MDVGCSEAISRGKERTRSGGTGGKLKVARQECTPSARLGGGGDFGQEARGTDDTRR